LVTALAFEIAEPNTEHRPQPRAREGYSCQGCGRQSQCGSILSMAVQRQHAEPKDPPQNNWRAGPGGVPIPPRVAKVRKRRNSATESLRSRHAHHAGQSSFRCDSLRSRERRSLAGHESFNRTIEDSQEPTYFPRSLCAFQARSHGSGCGPENSRRFLTGLRAGRCALLMDPAAGDLSRTDAQRMSVPSHVLQIQDRWADLVDFAVGATRVPKHYAVTEDQFAFLRHRARTRVFQGRS
jgi:hypothetical protein